MGWGSIPQLEVDLTRWVRRATTLAPQGSFVHYCGHGVLIGCVMLAAYVVWTELQKQAREASGTKRK
jgi:hypothetical protein